MLLGEYLGRNHERRLVAVLQRREHREQGDGGLAAAHVALKQAVHRHVRLHVVEYARDGTLLRVRQLEGEHREDRSAHARRDLDERALRLLDALGAADGDGERDPEELLEDEAQVRGASGALILGERRVLGGEVYASQRVCARSEVLAFDEVGGQSLLERAVVETA